MLTPSGAFLIPQLSPFSFNAKYPSASPLPDAQSSTAILTGPSGPFPTSTWIDQDYVPDSVKEELDELMRELGYDVK